MIGYASTVDCSLVSCGSKMRFCPPISPSMVFISIVNNRRSVLGIYVCDHGFGSPHSRHSGSVRTRLPGRRRNGADAIHRGGSLCVSTWPVYSHAGARWSQAKVMWGGCRDGEWKAHGPLHQRSFRRHSATSTLSHHLEMPCSYCFSYLVGILVHEPEDPKNPSDLTQKKLRGISIVDDVNNTASSQRSSHV